MSPTFNGAPLRMQWRWWLSSCAPCSPRCDLKTKKAMRAEALHPLVVVVRHALTHEEQLEAVARICTLAGCGSGGRLCGSLFTVPQDGIVATHYHYGFDKVASLQCDATLDAWVQRALAHVRATGCGSATLRVEPFVVGLTEALGYPPGSSLRRHVDWVDGVNVVLSLGADTAYRWGATRDTRWCAAHHLSLSLSLSGGRCRVRYARALPAFRRHDCVPRRWRQWRMARH